jgi:hypothetical protein
MYEMKLSENYLWQPFVDTNYYRFPPSWGSTEMGIEKANETKPWMVVCFRTDNLDSRTEPVAESIVLGLKNRVSNMWIY